MAAPTPALVSTFQSAGGQGEGAGTLLLPFKGTTPKLHTSLPFISHQPGFNHMATPTCKGVWECSLLPCAKGRRDIERQPAIFTTVADGCGQFTSPVEP